MATNCLPACRSEAAVALAMTITAMCGPTPADDSSASVEPASAASRAFSRAILEPMQVLLGIYMYDEQDGEIAEGDSEVEDPGLTDIISRS